MSLLKLWNSLCGRSATEKPETEASASTSEIGETTPAVSQASQGREPEANANETKTSVPKTGTTKTATTKTTVAKGLFGFGRSNVESGLCKLLAPLKVASLLEIGVGDGSRAVAVVSAIQKNNPGSPLRYCAIDSFEMASSPEHNEAAMSLMQFHQRLRSAGISPQIFPGSLDQELLRLCHTVGRVDVVLIAEDAPSWQNPTTLRNLQRVCHETTVVFHGDAGTWKRYQTTLAETRKAA
ncbi:hypothetical protein Q31b_40870 [Novipirellula aureliae]|uniref:Uncharacterized protein n=1 Tax=Novipirellula aureliae TaxID=2527966 RepID=A0A5C6DSU6_9BACT|nr:hypothetical protein [Novipirellula aureliae]TWU39007.1 hypothetical protein Q31b_40870 [Novipirellula aureliae]